MNGKKLAALAFAASLAASTLPALAVAPVPITVKWNTQSIGSLQVWNQSTAAQTRQTTAESIFSNLNGGAGSCAASDTEAANGTVNFGNVTPDATNYTDCLEDNAANVFVSTNDSNGYNVTVQATAGTPANYATATGPVVCVIPNLAFANNGAYATSTHTTNASVPAVTAGNACGAGNFAITSAAATTLLTTAAATAATNLSSDLELALNNNAPTGAVSMTVTYTLNLL